MDINWKLVRRVVGFIVLGIILLRGKALTVYVEDHPAAGIILLLCAVAYVLWGMFWKKDEA